LRGYGEPVAPELQWLFEAVEGTMPVSRKTGLKSAQYEKNVGKKNSANSGSKKKEQQYTVGPVMLAVFLFVVVGSAIVQIISSAQRGLP